IFFIPDELRTYVGLKPESSEPVPHQSETDGEEAPLMEEERNSRGGEEGKYKFCGAVIRLTPRDYDHWRKIYSAIPDFDAELQRIDDTFRAKPPDKRKDWFPATSAMLAAKHQKLSSD